MTSAADPAGQETDLSASDWSLQLPYDRLRTPSTGAGQDCVSGKIPVSCDGDATGFFGAAAVALFYRYSGQDSIPLGVVTPSRRACRLVVPVDGGTTVGALSRTIEAALASESPVQVPARGSAVRLVVGNGTESVVGLEGAELVFHVEGSGADWSLTLYFLKDLFDLNTIEQLHRHFSAIATAMATRRTGTIRDLDLEGPAESAWYARNGAGEPVEFSFEPVHAEVSGSAFRYPDKVAVRHRSGSLTYQQLEQASNRLANWLVAQGVGADTRVVVCVKPCLEIAVSLLAIFKAGGTYVAVNPDHPRNRIDVILDDTDPSVIITQQALRPLVGSSRARVVEVEAFERELAGISDSNPDVSVTPGQTAYIYYTSGTTGVPKGVMASYGNMVQFIRSSRDRYGISSEEIMPSVASYTFSISMFELMSPLSVGGTLIVLDRETVLDPVAMADVLAGVTMFHIGPSLLKSILKYIKSQDMARGYYDKVRHASSGGDMVPPELLQDLRELFRHAEVCVIYGCSEISLMGCTWRVRSRLVPRSYVGRPFANVRLLVLDDDGNRVPPGAIGDVCFGGPGVVAGYLNRPELVETLFFERDNVRYYRTGDRGRMTVDGKLELLGRRDFQVQLRGMRIELAEIEYHLRAAPGVRDGVVAARQRGDGESILVAYFVPEDGNTEETAHSLRDYLGRNLPDYMVPALYMALEALPLNHNMKVDRRALPDYQSPSASVDNPARTGTEIAIADLWCRLLRVEAVDVHSNFMSLGGDSLLAMDFILSIERDFGVRLDGLEILRESLAVLAALVDSRSGRESSEAAVGPSRAAPIRQSESVYFGSSSDLYGVFEHPSRDESIVPVLLCPPLGTEYYRCQYLYRLLAENLADAGAMSLRFDFFGSGDSAGEDVDATLSRWRSDIREAADALRHKSGSKSIRVFAMRFGAVTALQALSSDPIDRWVLWDPAVDGAVHLGEWQRMDREKALKLLVMRNLKMPRQTAQVRQILGTRFSGSTVHEIQQAALTPAGLPDFERVFQVLSEDAAAHAPTEEARRRVLGDAHVLRLSVTSDWYNAAMVTAAITHRDIVSSLRVALTDGQP